MGTIKLGPNLLVNSSEAPIPVLRALLCSDCWVVTSPQGDVVWIPGFPCHLLGHINSFIYLLFFPLPLVSPSSHQWSSDTLLVLSPGTGHSPVPPGLGHWCDTCCHLSHGCNSPQCLSLSFSSLLRLVKFLQHLDLCISAVGMCRVEKEQIL